MGFMDRALDQAMDKLEERFGELIRQINELDGRLDRMIEAQNRTNDLLEQLNGKIASA